MNNEFIYEFRYHFLVASTRLYNPLCPSVGWSFTLYFFYDFISLTSLLLPKWSDLKYSPCPPVSRVSGLVRIQQHIEYTGNKSSIIQRGVMKIKHPNKAGYTATEVACGWAGAIFEVTRSFGQEQ